MYSLVRKSGKESFSKPIKMMDSPAFKSLNANSFKVLKLLAEKPMYASEISKKLVIHEQKIYYYLNSLKKAGLISVVREEVSRGAVCKYYSPTALAFGFEIKKESTKLKDDSDVRSFFSDFIGKGVFEGSFVVSAPFQHGPFLTAARDGHTAVQLALFLGKYCETPERFIVKLDTEVKSEHEEKRSMILIGGPVTNILTNEINEKLSVKFVWEKSWTIESSFTGKSYDGDDVSMIAKIKNPWDKSKSIILLCGLKYEGTKAAVLSVTQYCEKVLRKYEAGKDFYCIIKGLDMDGDGKTDDIQVLESHSV